VVQRPYGGWRAGYASSAVPAAQRDLRFVAVGPWHISQLRHTFHALRGQAAAGPRVEIDRCEQQKCFSENPSVTYLTIDRHVTRAISRANRQPQLLRAHTLDSRAAPTVCFQPDQLRAEIEPRLAQDPNLNSTRKVAPLDGDAHLQIRRRGIMVALE
jgi:hypothetical protein